MYDLQLPKNYQEEVLLRLNKIESLLPELKRIYLENLETKDLDINFKTNEIDLVTKVDYIAENTILHFLQTNFPNDSILSEESGIIKSLIDKNELKNFTENSYQWVIDPLDGTINYAHSIPLFSVSIGIVYNSFPVGGLVYLPVFNDIYRAIYKEGAYKNHQRIYVSDTKELSKALIVTGFPYNRKTILNQIIKSFEKILDNTRGLRRTGSAALDLCWLAEGRFDGHYEWNLSPWDTTAGVVILKEAGGLITNEKNEEYKPGDYLMIASNGKIHKEFTELLLN